LEAMLRQGPFGHEDLVVEVGCGTGRLTLPMASITPARVMGVDPEPRMLEVAKAKDGAGRVAWARGSAYRLPLQDASAALVVMVMVVHLLRQRGRAFSEARRVLRPDGRLSIWTFTPRHVEDFYLNAYFPSIARIDRPRFPAIDRLTSELRRSGFVEVGVELIEEPRTMNLAEVVDRVRGRYISTLTMLPPLEYRLGLQRLEEMLAQNRSITLTQRSEWAILTAR
jgi:ubiquinone/menaquinone biosynthesis C-methylase UbiE